MKLITGIVKLSSANVIRLFSDNLTYDVNLTDYTASTLQTEYGNVLGGVSVAASTTSQAGFGGVATFSATGGRRRRPVVQAGTLKKLYIMIDGTQPVDGALVFTILKNGSPTGITITVAAGFAANNTIVSDLVNTAAINAGDTIELRAANASASASLLVISYSIGNYI